MAVVVLLLAKFPLRIPPAPLEKGGTERVFYRQVLGGIGS